MVRLFLLTPIFFHYDIFQISIRMSEAHFDEFEHYNFDQDKAMRSGHSGKANFWNQNCPFTGFKIQIFTCLYSSFTKAIYYI